MIYPEPLKAVFLGVFSIVDSNHKVVAYPPTTPKVFTVKIGGSVLKGSQHF